MEQLGLTFLSGEVLKAEKMTLLKNKVNELVTEVNTLPSIVAATKTNALEIEAIKEGVVYLPQAKFEDMEENGELDPTKEYNTYEE